MSMKHTATFNLMHRYARVAPCLGRAQTDGCYATSQGHEAEFLPAALALRDTPLHPAPRIAMGLIMLFAAIALVWAVFGKIDIVASAQGKLIPDDRSKVIQPMETASVLAIHVRDGQRVAAGDLLIELDATQALADTTRVNQDLLAARLEVALARALLASLESRRRRACHPTLQ
jgi:hemolysin D